MSYDISGGTSDEFPNEISHEIPDEFSYEIPNEIPDEISDDFFLDLKRIVDE